MPNGTEVPACQPKKGKDFRVETRFVGGKMKKRKIPLVEGQPVEEFIRQNADALFLTQAGRFEILHERETGVIWANEARGQSDKADQRNNGPGPRPAGPLCGSE